MLCAAPVPGSWLPLCPGNDAHPQPDNVDFMANGRVNISPAGALSFSFHPIEEPHVHGAGDSLRDTGPNYGIPCDLLPTPITPSQSQQPETVEAVRDTPSRVNWYGQLPYRDMVCR